MAAYTLYISYLGRGADMEMRIHLHEPTKGRWEKVEVHEARNGMLFFLESVSIIFPSPYRRAWDLPYSEFVLIPARIPVEEWMGAEIEASRGELECTRSNVRLLCGQAVRIAKAMLDFAQGVRRIYPDCFALEEQPHLMEYREEEKQRERAAFNQQQGMFFLQEARRARERGDYVEALSLTLAAARF